MVCLLDFLKDLPTCLKPKACSSEDVEEPAKGRVVRFFNHIHHESNHHERNKAENEEWEEVVDDKVTSRYLPQIVCESLYSFCLEQGQAIFFFCQERDKFEALYR